MNSGVTGLDICQPSDGQFYTIKNTTAHQEIIPNIL
jgi:hypothetical protein